VVQRGITVLGLRCYILIQYIHTRGNEKTESGEWQRAFVRWVAKDARVIQRPSAPHHVVGLSKSTPFASND